MIRANIVMTEAGSAAAAAPLAGDERLATRFWLSEAAARHSGIAANPLSQAAPAAIGGADILLLSMTGRAIEGDLALLARDAGLPSVQLLDTWGPYEHRRTAPLADRIAVVDDAARREAIEAGLPAERISVVGQAAWETAPILPAAPASTVAFLSQPIAHLYGKRLGYDEASTLALLEAVARSRPDLVGEILVVRHPEGDLLARDTRTVPLGAALAQAGTVVGMFSSALVDALLGGRRVVSVQPDVAGADRCPLSRHARIPRALDEVSLITALETSRTEPADLAAYLKSSARRLGDLLIATAGACRPPLHTAAGGPARVAGKT